MELRTERRFAALDGMRAIAVMLVLFGHANFHCNGAIGVDIFFVLSGYLITSIILTELKKTGDLNLKNFYMRRFLRLLPALLLLIVLYFIYELIFKKQKWYRVIGDAAMALGYISNWTRAYGHRPKYIAHTWSLSIEEQFYLVWPVLTVAIYWLVGKWSGGLRAREGAPGSNAQMGTGGLMKDVDPSAGFAICMAGAILLWLYRDFDRVAPGATVEQAQRNFFRIYFGTDTRGDTLLAGAALAFWTPRIPRFLAIIVGWLGVLAVVWLCTRMHLTVGIPYPDGTTGPPLYQLVGVHWWVPRQLVLWGVPHPYGHVWICTLAILIGLLNDRNGVLSWILSIRPLAWIGVISYGLYLYHFPIMVQLGHATEWNWDRWDVAAVAIPMTFAIATLSFHLVEKPCLRLKDQFRSGGQSGESTQKEGEMPQETKAMPQNPDDLEHAPGFAHEKLEGSIPAMASEADIRDALEKAFDYRGDVTITKKDGTTVEGYIFDRRPGMTLVDSSVRLFPKDHDEKISIAYDEIAALSFTGKDTAAGKTWETWLKKYREKKAAGEKNIGLDPEKLD